MMTVLALVVLLLATGTCAELEGREARLRAGVPGWGDLARITGQADLGALRRLPGVSLSGDGRPRLDPARRSALPIHLTGSLVEHRVGHGLCLACAVAAIGLHLERADLPLTASLLLVAAGCYQLVARLYVLTLWAEGRSPG
ncbi:MAG: hypothetical protein U1E17_03710 [Geminicoccaceae bacterium]